MRSPARFWKERQLTFSFPQTKFRWIISPRRVSSTPQHAWTFSPIRSLSSSPKRPAELTPAALIEPAIKRLALADPKSVPAGVYAREYLTKLGLWNAVAAKIVPTENVRAALAAVESGNVEAGIVYKTDAKISKAVRIAYEVSAAEGPKISYPVAVVKGTRHADAAKSFLQYLKSGPALAVFKKYGFIVRQ